MTGSLYPCPFCGGIDIDRADDAAVCITCAATGPAPDVRDHPADARWLERWNERNTDARAFAMAKFVERLCGEGYVRAERQAELLERLSNMKAKRGFLTNAEICEHDLADLMGA